MIIINILISFFLQSILTNFISLNTKFLNPLFVLSSLILICPYFKNNYKYYITALLMGFSYDALFSALPFQNAFVFVLLSYIIRFLYKNFRENFLSIHIFQFIIIFFYRVFDYLLLIMIEDYDFTINNFNKILLSSFLLNMIYITVLYFIMNYITKILEKKFKKNIKKI